MSESHFVQLLRVARANHLKLRRYFIAMTACPVVSLGSRNTVRPAYTEDPFLAIRLARLASEVDQVFLAKLQDLVVDGKARVFNIDHQGRRYELKKDSPELAAVFQELAREP